MLTVSKARYKRVKRTDKVVRWVITLDGVTIIASVIGILLLIVSVTLPLFQGADSTIRGAVAVPSSFHDRQILAVGIDRVELGEQGEQDAITAYLVTESGQFPFLDFSKHGDGSVDLETPYRPLSDGVLDENRLMAALQADVPEQADAAVVRTVRSSGGTEYTLLWSDGSVSLVGVELEAEFDELHRRSVKPILHTRTMIPPESDAQLADALVRRQSEDGDESITCVKLLEDNRLLVLREVTEEDILGNAVKKLKHVVIDEGIPGAVTAVTMNRAGRCARLFLRCGTSPC